MSTTITPVLPEGFSWNRPESFDDYDWCLCAQMAPSPCELIHTAEGRAILREHAHPGCAMCKGTGLDPKDSSLYAPSVNWGEGNAEILFNLLGIADRLGGQLPIGRMRMHLQKARVALRERGVSLERPEVREMRIAAGEGSEPSAIVPRFISAGLNVEDMEERLGRLDSMLDEAELLGCQEVSWS